MADNEQLEFEFGDEYNKARTQGFSTFDPKNPETVPPSPQGIQRSFDTPIERPTERVERRIVETPVGIGALKEADDLNIKLGRAAGISSEISDIFKAQEQSLKRIAELTEHLVHNSQQVHETEASRAEMAERDIEYRTRRARLENDYNTLLDERSKKKFEPTMREAALVEGRGEEAVFQVGERERKPSEVRDLLVRYKAQQAEDEAAAKERRQAQQLMTADERREAQEAKTLIMTRLPKIGGGESTVSGISGVVGAVRDAVRSGRGISGGEVLGIARAAQFGPVVGGLIAAATVGPAVIRGVQRTVSGVLDMPVGQYQETRQLGQQVGGGFGEGLEMRFRAFRLGLNPFDAISGATARAIITGVEGRGFRDEMAEGLEDAIADSVRDLGIPVEQALDLMNKSVIESGETIGQFRRQMATLDDAARDAQMGQQEYIESLISLRTQFATTAAFGSQLTATQLARSTLGILPAPLARGSGLQGFQGLLQTFGQQYGVPATGRMPWEVSGSLGLQARGLEFGLDFLQQQARAIHPQSRVQQLQFMAAMLREQGITMNPSQLRAVLDMQRRPGGIAGRLEVSQGLTALQDRLRTRRTFDPRTSLTYAEERMGMDAPSRWVGSVTRSSFGWHGWGEPMYKREKNEFEKRREAIDWAQSQEGKMMTGLRRNEEGKWEVRVSTPGVPRMDAIAAERQKFFETTLKNILTPRQERYYQEHLRDQRFNVRRFLRNQGLLRTREDDRWGTNANIGGIVEVRLKGKAAKTLEIRGRTNQNSALNAADKGMMPLNEAYDQYNRSDRTFNQPTDWDTG